MFPNIYSLVTSQLINSTLSESLIIYLNLSWNILHTTYILQLQQPVHRLKMEILMSQCTDEKTQTTINTTLQQLLFASYLKILMHAICRLQREQPVCRFKAKTLISLRANEATQTNIFSNWQQECFDIKDNLYNQFFIITSTEFWTFRTFHPSLHESVAKRSGQISQNRSHVT